MQTESIVNWLRDRAKGADWSWRYVMLEAANRLEQLNTEKHGLWIEGLDGSYMCSECRKVSRYEIGYYCPNCGAKMDFPNVTDQTKAALEEMGRKSHWEE